ncbi:MAG TPA: hypothetical protein VH877_26555 [Polyangia bacterium]|nr:hypothetical protein [Polyangia bacterium]
MWRPLLCALLCLLPVSAYGGVWARDLGGVYGRYGAGFYFGQGAFLVANTQAQGKFQSHAGEIYEEVGFGHNFEVDLSARWVNNRNLIQDGTVLSNGGPEDTEVQLRWGPFHGKNALSLFAGVRVALYERLPVTQTADGTPQRGAGGQDILFGLAYGRSFYPRAAWFTFDITPRIRLESPTRGLRFRLELGTKLWGPILGAFNLEAQPVIGRRAGQENDPIAPVPITLSIGAKIFVRLPLGFGLIADFSWFPNVFNDGPGVRVGAGLTYEFDAKNLRPMKATHGMPHLGMDRMEKEKK